MAFLNDNALDSGLAWVDTNGTRLDITSADPGGTYSSVTTNTLGNKTAINVTAPANHATDGRQVTVPAITDGSVTGSGLATHWALTNGTDTVVASGTLTASQSVTSGNTFTLDEIIIAIRDATSV